MAFHGIFLAGAIRHFIEPVFSGYSGIFYPAFLACPAFFLDFTIKTGKIGKVHNLYGVFDFTTNKFVWDFWTLFFFPKYFLCAPWVLELQV